ncbi:hypothetical protein K435DRAFT_802199 [Dendrothele bispora CBS 962.96]|uniref:Uncharacterized protein n=1 Tax=Dendrothele bispora (strain CBS 962.96) TaxID=1314807 RepID=A0A4S8LLS1_DENBC|nr:hypothetical protein K435DRAFT_802199 [Dendrothele bispora CBS 962.96]
MSHHNQGGGAPEFREPVWDSYAQELSNSTAIFAVKLSVITKPALTSLLTSPLVIDLRTRLAQAFLSEPRLPPVDVITDFLMWAGWNQNSYPELAKTLDKLPAPYPTPDRYIAENKATCKKWFKFLKDRPLSDGHLRRRRTLLLDEKLIRYDLSAEESAIFVDADSWEMIVFVFRNWSGDLQLAQAINDVVVEGVKQSTSVRKEDPGSLVIAGWSAGARNANCFDWCNNLRKKSLTPHETYEICHLQSVLTVNYARYIHKEFQPHKWGVAWTTFRSRCTSGGLFLVCDYGLRIRPAADTVHGWQPGKFHGTGLPDTCPNPWFKFPEVVQLGLSIVTSNRIESVFEKYVNGLVDLAKIEETWNDILAKKEEYEFLDEEYEYASNEGDDEYEYASNKSNEEDEE